MKNTRKILMAILAMMMLLCIQKQASAAPTPLNLSFDDCIDNKEAFNSMDAYGIVGTENVVTDWVGKEGRLTWDDIANRKNHKWEIGNHTDQHGSAIKQGTAKFIKQGKTAQQIFLKHGFLQATSLALPFGDGYVLDKNGNVVLKPALLKAIKALGFITSARQAYVGDNPSALNHAADFNPWAIRVYSWKQGDSLSELTALVDQAVAENAFLVIVIHTVAQYPDPADEDQISLDKFKLFIDYLAVEISQGRIMTTTTSDGAGQMIRQQLALPPKQ